MTDIRNEFAVFVKPWRAMELPALAAHVRALGFRSIELPVRPGFPCEPESIERDLPSAARILADQGVRILNITAALPLDDERLYAACAASGVGMNRVMFRLGELDYWAAEQAARAQLDAALPLCERYGVQIGVQNHSGSFVGVHEMGLHALVEEYDPRYVGAIWDAAHNALEGMAPEAALDIVAAPSLRHDGASHLCCVNLKNAYWQRVNGPEAPVAEWKIYWTSGRHGRASWPRVAAKLAALDYTGPICFSAEYSDDQAVNRLIVEDLAFAQECFRLPACLR